MDDLSVLLPQQSPPSSSVASNAASVLPSSGAGGAAATTDGGAPLVVSNTQSTMNRSNMVGTGVMTPSSSASASASASAAAVQSNYQNNGSDGSNGVVMVGGQASLSLLAAGSSNPQDVIRSLQDDLQSMKIALKGSFLNDCF